MANEKNVNIEVNLKSWDNGKFVGGVMANYTNQLWEASHFQNNASNPARYSMSLIIAKKSPAFKVLQDAVIDAMTRAYGADLWKAKYETFKNQSTKCFFSDSSVKSNASRYDEIVAKYGDCIVMTAYMYANKVGSRPIGVFDRDGERILSAEFNKPAPGDFVNASFFIWVQKDSATPGLRAQAHNIQYVASATVELANSGVDIAKGIEKITMPEDDAFDSPAAESLM